MLPIITIEIGGDFWIEPKFVVSKWIQEQEKNNLKLIFEAKSYRIGWLYFAIGILFEIDRRGEPMRQVKQI